jgi:predicted nucleotidyltransferase component of viral defense system
MAERVNLNFAGFRPEMVEKVIRLLLVLDRIANHRFLDSRMCLHGGTALNVFVLGLPRLSVDIDLNYVADKSQMAEVLRSPKGPKRARNGAI